GGDGVLHSAPGIHREGEAGLLGDASLDRAGRGGGDRLGRHAAATREHLASPAQPDRPGLADQGPPPLTDHALRPEARNSACPGSSDTFPPLRWRNTVVPLTWRSSTSPFSTA